MENSVLRILSKSVQFNLNSSHGLGPLIKVFYKPFFKVIMSKIFLKKNLPEILDLNPFHDSGLVKLFMNEIVLV